MSDAQRFPKLTQNPLGCQPWNCLQSKEGSMAAPGIVSRILHQSGAYRVEMNRANQFQEIAVSVNSECLVTTLKQMADASFLLCTQRVYRKWISDIRARQKASRNTVILRLSRLGWRQEKISETVGLSRNRVSEIIGNTNFGNIDNLLSQGHDMDYIARHYNMELSLCTSKRDNP